MRKNPAPGNGPGLPARIEADVRRLMDLPPDLKLELACRLEASGDPDLIRFSAAIRNHVATQEGGA